MEQAKQHVFLVITKRPQTFLDFCIHYGIGEMNIWPPNIWLLITAENQEQADKRLPLASQIPAAKRIVLYEPALGPLNFRWAKWAPIKEGLNTEYDGLRMFDGVICGGETGPHARPMHPDWPRKLRDDCQAAGVPFFFKSWGEWAPYIPQPGGNLGADVRRGIVMAVHPTGESYEEVFDRTGRNTIPGTCYMKRVGKHAAGRLLDDRTWEELPE
jgi:protein gp37